MSDGSLMEAKIADELQQQSPIPDNTFDIFDRFFLDKRKVNRLTMIVNTEAGVVVACSEENSAADIQPDCSGMPMLHLFLVAMSGLNVRSVTHLATTATPNTGKFSIWVDG
ncbi:hypothetical protein [Sphingomonas sp. 1P08PE]|uniref:hypothetical protein n=1 Tax=Sphingomonas sp. 1P08PE TaxID=554122 RepID=UPI0039A19D6D